MPEDTLDPLLDLISKEFQKKSFMVKKKTLCDFPKVILFPWLRCKHILIYTV